MKTDIKLKYVLVLSLTLSACAVFGHDVPVHMFITRAAAQSAYGNSPAFQSFIDNISDGSDFNYPLAENSLVEGSSKEDGPFDGVPKEVGGYRSLNHFYDPLDPTFGKGLSDSPPDHRALKGKNSFAWASISNCVGINTYIPYNPHPINLWSWQNARYYEWLGLTSTDLGVRKVNLDNMFRAAGQVMHLLEDTSQPQHVRNEQHLDTLGTFFWESPIEDYGLKNKENLNYQHGMLPWRNDGFTKLEDFWDRHLYNGDASALILDANGELQLGLAEFSNGNFIGDRHSYAEYFPKGPGDIRWYPYPSRKDTVKSTNKVNSTFLNKVVGQRYYLSKTGDGVPVTYHSILTLFGVQYPNIFKKESTTIRDDNVLKNYHDILITNAVRYSAGLLDYYFRGGLDITCMTTNSSTGKETIYIVNTSTQDFKDGAFHLFWDNSGGTRAEITGANFSTTYTDTGALAVGGTTEVTFVPTNAVSYLLLYQGTIGTSGGTNSDPVDAGIAIAAKKFTIDTSLNFNNLGWLPQLHPSGVAATNHWSCSVTDDVTTIFQTDGSYHYTGPDVTCQAHLEIAATSTNSDWLIQVWQKIDDDWYLLLQESRGYYYDDPVAESGNFNFTFTMYESIDSEIEVDFRLDAANSEIISAVGKLTPACP